MPKSKSTPGISSEVKAIGEVHSALNKLDAPAQLRVIRYVSEMLGIGFDGPRTITQAQSEPVAPDLPTPLQSVTLPETQSDDDAEGINPVALKWIKRSGLTPGQLQSIFSLGIDEIDLVAKKIPGENKKERMHNVIILKGIAAYLGTGAPRVTFEQVKEACLHYDAYDSPNFAAHLRSFAADVGSTKEAGFTLTARGLTAGTALVKQMIDVK